MIQQQVLSNTHYRQDIFVLRDKKNFSDLYFSDLLELEIYLLDYINNNEYFKRYQVINNKDCKYFKDIIKTYLIFDNNERLIFEFIIMKDYLFYDRK